MVKKNKLFYNFTIIKQTAWKAGIFKGATSILLFF